MTVSSQTTTRQTDGGQALAHLIEERGVCGTCANARGIRNLQLVEGIEISNMAELAQCSVDADKVFTF